MVAFKMSDLMGQPHPGLEVIVTHSVDQVVLSDLVFRILPTHNIYNPIYNVFMKKMLPEEFPGFDLVNWADDTVFWYDKCYCLIKEYFDRIHKDIATNSIANIIDFDRLTKPEYLADLLDQHFGLEFDRNRRAFVEKYAQLQLPIDLADDDSTSMQDILAPITDQMLRQNPWFWAYAVFKFEHNNNLTEQDRLWSVNNFKIPQTRNDLLRYQFLKQTESNK
jgi:hypothetical protein